MNKMFKSIHGSKKSTSDKVATSNTFDRFLRQNQNRNIFYFVLNGIAMPLAYSKM